MTEQDLLVGLARILDDASVGVYDTDRTWTETDTAVAVVIGNQIPQDPPQLVSLDSYIVHDDPILNDTTIAVQFRIRGDEDANTAKTRAGAIFNLIQGMRDVTVNGVPVVLCERASQAPLGPDKNNRVELSANYYVQVAWPTLYRTD